MVVATIYNYCSNTGDGNIVYRIVKGSPLLVVTTLALYLLTVLNIAPRFMKSRPAYKLKTFTAIYNVIQILACVYYISQYHALPSKYQKFWTCPDLATTDETQYYFLVTFSFLLKVVELSETVVFVLRKKYRQVSFLHTFHHCTTVTLTYLLLENYKGTAAIFPIVVNCYVHVIMYFYYFLSVVCPQAVIKKLNPFKKAITVIQLTQFGVILLQTMVVIARGCKLALYSLIVFITVICAYVYLFWDFYKKNYL